MKKLLLSYLLFFLSFSVFAQSPQYINYQAVLRSNSGNIIFNQPVNLKVSIHDLTFSGTIVFQETHSANTNQFGVVSLKIGSGSQLIGPLASVIWETGDKFVEIEVDYPVGTGYASIGTQQLVSVPYALHAKKADSLVGGINETDPIFTISPANGITSGNISNWNTAYSWGNHASAGYLTNFTENDPVFIAHPANGITSTLIGNWNTAYGWGNHANAGYLTSFTETDPVYSASVASGIDVADTAYWNHKLSTETQNLANVLAQNNDGNALQIKNIADPTDAQDAVTKAYVDALIERIEILEGKKILDIDGNIYNTVKIGNQVWMKENLRTSKYNNGELIANIPGSDVWAGLPTGAYCWYNNDSATYNIPYGKLYNWFAVDTGNLCPIGWHVPSNADWTILTNYLGGLSVAGGKLKEAGYDHWLSPNTNATNESGFTAVGTGYLHYSGAFWGLGTYCFYWSSNEYNISQAYGRPLSKNNGST
jgi:uncharacterized protein (TIGR02145 family)